jgi:hypothetical protein
MADDCSGEQNHAAKLSATQVLDIYDLSFQGVGTSLLARMFRVSNTTVRSIRGRRTWVQLLNAKRPLAANDDIEAVCWKKPCWTSVPTRRPA